MAEGLKFGTSGLRGLVDELVGGPAGAYAAAFLDALGEDARRGLLIGRDLRNSSPALAADCAAAAAARGIEVIDCGALPTPALALEASRLGMAAIMVTGSHIPEDRNGLKFYRAFGEITKADEAAILAAYRATGEPLATAVMRVAPFHADPTALERYRRRYVDVFPADLLAGCRVALFEQSSVARDLLADLLEGFGATVTRLGRADRFVPVDTEAHRPEDVVRIAEWGASGGFDAIVSTDGDADRPLVADETGTLLRGDILGLMTARFLGCRAIVTPVTSGSAIETSGVADVVRRTRVGSPFVIEAMQALAREGRTGIVGFEANGGVLLGTDVELPGGRLNALATRDAVLPILAALATSVRARRPLSRIVADLRPGHALADRLTDMPGEASLAFLERLAGDAAFRGARIPGTVVEIGLVDGVRMVLGDGSVLHYRASGNAPELRAYVEAASRERAETLLAAALKTAEDAVRRS